MGLPLLASGGLSPTGRCPWQGSSTPASGELNSPQGRQPRPAPLHTPALQGDQACLPGLVPKVDTRWMLAQTLACRPPCPRYLAEAKQQGLHRAAKVVHVFLELVGAVLLGQRRAQLGTAHCVPRPSRHCDGGDRATWGPVDRLILPSAPATLLLGQTYRQGAGSLLGPLTARLGCTTPSFPVSPRSTVRPRESRSLWPTVSMMVVMLPRLSSLQRAQAP